MSDSTTNFNSGEGTSFTERLIALGRAAEEGTAPDAASLLATPEPAADAGEASLEITERDIIFDCPRCLGELIVDRDGEQMETSCIHCGATLLVPKYLGPPSHVGKQRAQVAAELPAEAAAPVEHPTSGPATGDFPTGATQYLSQDTVDRALASTDTASAITSAPGPAAAEASIAAPEAPPSSDTATFRRPDGSLSPDVLQEMQELDLSGLDLEEVRKKVETVSRHLKENNSQVTEVTGYINQTSIKLHRFKLQLERLKKRNAEIHKEMRALKARAIQLGNPLE